ncbi:hypothetical protein [Clostridium paraputrificum]|uniref:hypothetical protein n=1 Tax=Clostridium paraputrificum TaxID=29363 RepID=UPI00189F12B3|nr:hypothetical protein [Clostridium paraputrificum]MDB2072177.1 hypothetical protein [Clostridium paraputrificum]MDB2082610.1 hypothetical protein [Clostridium paraputrificum]MDB2117081.1 hypothetical protein [Clostridium paraputrificum]
MSRNQVVNLRRIIVFAEKRSICDVIKKFQDSRVIQLNIKRIDETEGLLGVMLEMQVIGGMKAWIKILRKLNNFIAYEDINKDTGYVELTSIPAQYEVICNE